MKHPSKRKTHEDCPRNQDYTCNNKKKDSIKYYVCEKCPFNPDR